MWHGGAGPLLSAFAVSLSTGAPCYHACLCGFPCYDEVLLQKAQPIPLYASSFALAPPYMHTVFAFVRHLWQ